MEKAFAGSLGRVVAIAFKIVILRSWDLWNLRPKVLKKAIQSKGRL